MSAETYNFIIVDDEADIRLSIRRVLARCFASANILEATTGHEALQLYHAHGADLIIVDHHIPLLDGLSFVRFLRAQNISIPLVVTSNNSQLEHDAVAAGATRFLNKRELFTCLEKSLATWLS